MEFTREVPMAWTSLDKRQRRRIAAFATTQKIAPYEDRNSSRGAGHSGSGSQTARTDQAQPSLESDCEDEPCSIHKCKGHDTSRRVAYTQSGRRVAGFRAAQRPTLRPAHNTPQHCSNTVTNGPRKRCVTLRRPSRRTRRRIAQVSFASGVRAGIIMKSPVVKFT